MNKKQIILIIFALIIIVGLFLYSLELIKQQPTKIYKLEEIFTPEEKINFSQIAPNGTYAFVGIQNSNPEWIILGENKNGPIIVEMDSLVFVNLITKEKKEFNLYDLAPKEMIDPLKKIPVQTQFMLYVHLLKWSENSNDFWGAINLMPGADPSFNEAVSLFKINTVEWNIERYQLPDGYINTLKQENLNLNRNNVLIELVDSNNGLYLYSYNVNTRGKNIIVSYPSKVFNKYLPRENSFVGYFNPWFLEIESRQLNAKWLNENTISYTDFVTREEIIKRIK